MNVWIALILTTSIASSLLGCQASLKVMMGGKTEGPREDSSGAPSVETPPASGIEPSSTPNPDNQTPTPTGAPTPSPTPTPTVNPSSSPAPTPTPSPSPSSTPLQGVPAEVVPASGTVEKIVNRLSPIWTDKSATETPLITNSILTVDAWGNVISSMNAGILRVLCQENTNAPYCISKSIGKYHLLVGAKVQGTNDGASGVAIADASIGNLGGVKVSSTGNIYFTDKTFFRIRVICYDIASPGFCSGKQVAYMYNVAGTGIRGMPSNDVAGTSSMLNTPLGLDLDSSQNIVFADYNASVVLKLCLNPGPGSLLCNGLTAGNLYMVAGNGTAADGADDAAATSVSIGFPYGPKILSGANVFFSDNQFRVRVVCLTLSGYCSGKTAGNIYRVAGIGGSDLDGDDNLPFATTAIGRPAEIENDGAGNLLVSDFERPRVRLLCINTSGQCTGKTAGNHYHYAGSGIGAADIVNGAALNTDIFAPYGIVSDANGNFIFTQNPGPRVGAICHNSTGICSGHPNSTLRRVQDAYVYAEPANGSAAMNGNWGSIRALSTDAANNYYFYSYTFFKFYVRCNENVTPASACFGKTVGTVHHLAGDGIEADGPSGVPAVTSSLNEIRGSIVDSDYNLILANYRSYRVRLLCINETGRCAGKTKGNVYNIAGTGVTGTSDNVLAETATISNVTDLVINSLGNLFFVSYDGSRKIWAVCTSVNAGDFCQGKTAGNLYEYAGGGSSTADGDDRLSAALGRTIALTVDAHDNIYWSTNAGVTPRNIINVICRTTPAPAGVCSGKTPGAIYRIAGNLAAGDGADNQVPSTTSIGYGSGMNFDSSGNLWHYDVQYARIRVICFNTIAPGFCQGRTTGNLYRYSGMAIYGSPGNGTALNQAALPSNHTSRAFILDRNSNFVFVDVPEASIYVGVP